MLVRRDMSGFVNWRRRWRLGLDWVRNRCFTLLPHVAWRNASSARNVTISSVLTLLQNSSMLAWMNTAFDTSRLQKLEVWMTKNEETLQLGHLPMKQKWWTGRKHSGSDKAVRPCLWGTMEWRRFPLKRRLLLAYTTFNQDCRDKSSQFISHSQFKRCHAQAMYLLTSVPPSKARQEEWC